jgi:hypothetical protein
MGVKLWMRNFAQQNLNRFPPANGGYAGVRPTFKSCAPTKPCPQEKSPQVTAVLRCGKPRRRNAPILHFQLRSETLQPFIFGCSANKESFFLLVLFNML